MDEGHTNKGYDGNISEKNIKWENKKVSRDDKDDEYDPYKHRNIKHPIRSYEALVHLLKGSLGTGILAMPAAFKNSGYAVGMVSTFIIGLICLYCVHILLHTNYEQSKKKASATFILS